MNPAGFRYQSTLGRVAVFLVPALILVLGTLWFVQPRVAAALRTQIDVRSLEERAAMVRATAAREGTVAAADASDAVRELERRVAADDRTAAVGEVVAHLVLTPPDMERARNLQIETGTAVRNETPVLAGAPQVVGASVAPTLDPRFSLFPTSLEYTPVTIGFESTYDRVGSFVWNLRDLPTMVEVRSLEITRALPLLQVKTVLFVYRRLPPAQSVPPAPSAAPAVPTQPQSQRRPLSILGGMP